MVRCTLPGLRAAREAAGLSVAALARASRTDCLLIKNLERQPRPHAGHCLKRDAERLAAALSTTTAALGAVWLG